MLGGLAHSFDAFVLFWNRASQFLFEWKPFDSFFNSQNVWLKAIADAFATLLTLIPGLSADYLSGLTGFELMLCGLTTVVILGSTAFAVASLVSKITDIVA